MKPMQLFRELDEQEIVSFKQWARENYTPFSEIKGIWHPVVQTECTVMNAKASMTEQAENSFA